MPHIQAAVLHSRLEKQIDRLPLPASEFLWFGLKQAWACLFGALLLLGIVATRQFYPEIPLSRYDFLVLYAVSIQLTLFFLKLESWREICVIFLYRVALQKRRIPE